MTGYYETIHVFNVDVRDQCVERMRVKIPRNVVLRTNEETHYDRSLYMSVHYFISISLYGIYTLIVGIYNVFIFRYFYKVKLFMFTRFISITIIVDYTVIIII